MEPRLVPLVLTGCASGGGVSHRRGASYRRRARLVARGRLGHPHRDGWRCLDEVAKLIQPCPVRPRRQRWRPAVGQASGQAMRLPTAGALVVAGQNDDPVAALAGRNREALQAGQPRDDRMVLPAGQLNLKERVAAGHVQSVPGVVLHQDVAGHPRPRGHGSRGQDDLCRHSGRFAVVVSGVTEWRCPRPWPGPCMVPGSCAPGKHQHQQWHQQADFA
jgi:hypothetical protein